MKLLVMMIYMVALGFSTATWAKLNPPDGDGQSEATTASPSYDPSREECKCLQPINNTLLNNNPNNDRKVAEWGSDPHASGPPPSLEESRSAK